MSDPRQTCPQGDLNSEAVEALYPSTGSPQLRFDTLSALCSYGQSPLVMEGALRQVLIQHFSSVENILNATIRRKLSRDGVWSPGTDTGICIESLHRWRPELTESRPGLVLKSGAWNWQRMGIGDKVHEDWKTGRQTFTGFWSGSHTVFALCNEPAEALSLAIEAMKCFLWFESEITRQLELQRFIPVSIGEVAALEESTEHYVVPITVAYVAPEAWHLDPDAPRTKRIVFRASDTLAYY